MTIDDLSAAAENARFRVSQHRDKYRAAQVKYRDAKAKLAEFKAFRQLSRVRTAKLLSLLREMGEGKSWSEKAELANCHLFRRPDGSRWTGKTIRAWLEAQG